MNADEFKKAFLPHHMSIRTVCRGLLASYADADDAVQEVYLKLWERREEIELPQNAAAYAVRVSRNHCLDRLRAAKRGPQQLSLDDETYPQNGLLASVEAPQSMEEREVELKFERWHQTLSEQKRRVFDLSHREHKSNSDIAKQLSLSEVNVRVMLSRLRQDLRTLIVAAKA